jgi:hypothetical protein
MNWENAPSQSSASERKTRKRKQKTETDGNKVASESLFWADDKRSDSRSDSDVWEPFEDLTRIDSPDEEISGAFSGFEPITLDEDTEASEEHDLLF